MLHQFLIAATGLYDPDTNGRPHIEAASWFDPAWPDQHLAAAAAVGDAEAIRRHLHRDPEAARRPCGPRAWVPLLMLCYSRVATEDSDWLASARALLDAGGDPAAFWRWGGQYHFAATTGVFGEGERGPHNQPRHPAGLALAEALLTAGADPNDAQGLYNRMFRPGAAHLALLLKHGLGPAAPLNWTDMDGSPTPGTTLQYQLRHAAEHGYTERVALILDAGVDPSVPDPSGGVSVWKLAAIGGTPEVVTRLEAAGATPVTLTFDEQLQAACLGADTAQARTLLAAHPGAKVPSDWLKRMSDRGRLSAIRLLLELGADPDAGPVPALHGALWNGQVEAARLLVEAGADVSIADGRFGGLPLGHAEHGGHPDAIAFARALG